MVKRDAENAGLDETQNAKRLRPSSIDHLSRLSDELNLRVLSYLSTAELTTCQRLSRKYQTLAGDSQLWKSHYYNRFVRPRARRLPGLKDSDSSDLHFASKASRWLDDEPLVRGGGKTNWKRQYKVRHNWTRGSCAVDEIPVAEEASIPPVIVTMRDGVVFMADRVEGLRAWEANGGKTMVAQMRFGGQRVPPTSLAVDGAKPDELESEADESSSADRSTARRVVVGFEDGSFGIYCLDIARRNFEHEYTHAPSVNGVVTSVAITWPYVLTMTATQLLSLYTWQAKPSTSQGVSEFEAPRLLHSLKSHTVWPPLTTSLRLSDAALVVSVAYALPTYLSGWTVGVQEIKLSKAGDLLESRTASAIDQHYRPLAFAAPPMTTHLSAGTTGLGLSTSSTLEMRHIHTKPTSLSYTHPYLLVSHPDNTLTLYLVSSTSDSLAISPGSRLWGHTSSVSGAHVGGRGKAVSVSKRGDELRVWELEGGFGSSTARKRLAGGDLSVRVRPESRSPTKRAEPAQAGLDLVNRDVGEEDKSLAEDDVNELTLTRGWIGFDEENVVVLKEQSQGRQALVVYDFT